MRSKSVLAWSRCDFSEAMRESSACICSASLSSATARLGAGRDRVALLDVDADDGAADARAGDELMDRLDGGDHRLAVGDLDVA